MGYSTDEHGYVDFVMYFANVQDLASAMDDGTAGQMVLSRNYWNALTSSSEQNAQTRDSESPGDGDDRGGSSIELGGLDWRSWDLKSGNVLIELTAVEAAVSEPLLSRAQSYTGLSGYGNDLQRQ